MAIKFEITQVCTYCWGTGKNPAYVPEGEQQAICPKCEGSGRAEIGRLDDIEDAFKDLSDKVDDVLDKCNDILEKLNEQ